MKHRITSLIIILFIIFLLISIMVNQSDSKIALNLSFFIAPKWENESGFLKSQEVCECVEKKAKELWSEEEFRALEKELTAHAEKMNDFFEQDKLNIVTLSTSGLPEPSIELQSKLKRILPFVSLCENECNTDVEF